MRLRGSAGARSRELRERGGAGARLHAQGFHMGGATRAEETTWNGPTRNTSFPSVLVHEKTLFFINSGATSVFLISWQGI